MGILKEWHTALSECLTNSPLGKRIAKPAADATNNVPGTPPIKRILENGMVAHMAFPSTFMLPFLVPLIPGIDKNEGLLLGVAAMAVSFNSYPRMWNIYWDGLSKRQLNLHDKFRDEWALFNSLPENVAVKLEDVLKSKFKAHDEKKQKIQKILDRTGFVAGCGQAFTGIAVLALHDNPAVAVAAFEAVSIVGAFVATQNDKIQEWTLKQYLADIHEMAEHYRPQSAALAKSSEISETPPSSPQLPKKPPNTKPKDIKPG